MRWLRLTQRLRDYTRKKHSFPWGQGLRSDFLRGASRSQGTGTMFFSPQIKARSPWLAPYPNPPALAAAVPSPNTLPPVEPRGLVKAGAEPNAGTPPNPGDPPKVGGLPNTGAAPKPPEQNRGKQTERGRGGEEKTVSMGKPREEERENNVRLIRQDLERQRFFSWSICHKDRAASHLRAWGPLR